jgi:hypothetical protein
MHHNTTKFKFILKNSFCIALLLTFAACNQEEFHYWWSRGQPPSVSELISRAETSLKEQLEENSNKRSDIAPLVTSISQALTSSQLQVAYEKLLELDGKISVTNRAPYGELLGQLRGFINAGSELDAKAFGMFASRVIFFLASELKVPAPNFS